MDDGTRIRCEDAQGDAEEELTRVVATYLSEQEREGVELPEGFPERAALAIALRARVLIGQLVFRCMAAGIDSAAPPGTVAASADEASDRKTG